MHRKLLFAAITLGAWACSDAARPVAPSSGSPMASVSTDDVAGAAFPGQRAVVLIEAYIDGRSELYLDGWIPGVQDWYHLDGAGPGRAGGVNLPTRLGAQNWYPEWGDVPDSSLQDCHCRSHVGANNLPWYPVHHYLDPRLRRGRGSVSFDEEPEGSIGIMFDDNAFPGAAWYTVSIDMRFPLQVQPRPRQSPYVVSLSKQKYVSLALLSYGAQGLDEPANLVEFSLGNDRGMETGIALGPGAVPLIRIADMNGDNIDDAVVRFPVSGLVYHGDAALGHTVLKVTARSPGYGHVRGDLPVTFVP
jgi:hypothetical protein